MNIHPRVLIVPLCLCAGAQTAEGQKLSYHGIAWHIPADSLRAPLAAQGFTFRTDAGDGDRQFAREDGTLLQAEMRDGRLVGFTRIDPVRGEGVDARFEALADSLRAELGAPDEVSEEGQQPLRLWEAGLWSVRVQVSRATGERLVQVAWRGPGWFDEMERRAGRAPQPAGFTTVSVTPFLRMAVDTIVRGPRAAGAMRGRFRMEYFQPITPRVDGVDQEQMDAVEYEMDFDCAARRTRLISRATYLQGRRLGIHRPQGQPWQPVSQPESHYARGLDAVCRAARSVR